MIIRVARFGADPQAGFFGDGELFVQAELPVLEAGLVDRIADALLPDERSGSRAVKIGVPLFVVAKY